MADFLRPMLEYEPERRATAQEMLSHPLAEGARHRADRAVRAGQRGFRPDGSSRGRAHPAAADEV